jgi:hypothetical protein
VLVVGGGAGGCDVVNVNGGGVVGVPPHADMRKIRATQARENFGIGASTRSEGPD